MVPLSDSDIDSMSETDKLNLSRRLLTSMIDKSHCGYCKMYVGDANEILTRYGNIQEDAVILDKIQHGRKEELGEIQASAVRMIQEQLPDNTTQENWTMFPRRQNGPGQRVKSNRFVKWAFGDFFEGLI